jgi:hypothetical protein
VQYATAPGTATADVDYVSTSGTLTWPAGNMTERSFAVQLLDERVTEPSETITLTLSNLSGGATLDGLATVDFTITDNDAAAPAADGGGGGGGAFDFLLLALLAAANVRRPSSRSRG